MADDVEKEIKAAQAKRKLITEEDISQAVLNNEKHASLTGVSYDTDLYTTDKYSGYVTFIPANEDEENEMTIFIKKQSVN
ncbi:unnamed protein product [Rhizopus microsporus]